MGVMAVNPSISKDHRTIKNNEWAHISAFTYSNIFKQKYNSAK